MTDHCDVQTFFWVWTKPLPLHDCDVMRFGVMCLWFDLLSSDVASCEVICGTTLRYYSVLQSTNASTTSNVLLQRTTPVLLCTTKVLRQYYSVHSTTPVLLQYYKVLRQYYSVLQRVTPVQQCTTPVLRSTTLVLTLYYKWITPVLQSITPSTTLYYKVLLQYHSVLQSTTPVLLCTAPVLEPY